MRKTNTRTNLTLYGYPTLTDKHTMLQKNNGGRPHATACEPSLKPTCEIFHSIHATRPCECATGDPKAIHMFNVDSQLESLIQSTLDFLSSLFGWKHIFIWGVVNQESTLIMSFSHPKRLQVFLQSSSPPRRCYWRPVWLWH